jgi:peptide/nickel transport system permease protein
MRIDYVVRRLLMFVVILWAAATLNFFLPRISGGDPIRSRLLQSAATGGAVQSGMAEMVEVYQEKFGLNDPLWQQYLVYLGDIARFDLGYSMANYPETVWGVLGSAIPWTVGLLLTTTLLAFGLGTLLGALLGWRHTPGWVQYLFPPLLLFSAVPFFLLGLILLYLFAFQWPIFPLFGGYSPGSIPEWSWSFAWDVLEHSFLPALSILLASMGFWALGMRGMMITAEGEDFMIFAEASGMKNYTLFFHFAVRNALLPQTTALGLSLATILSGGLLVEVIFNYPGVGGMLYRSILLFDYFVIQGIIFSIVLCVSIATLILDLIYPILDPRISYEGN